MEITATKLTDEFLMRRACEFTIAKESSMTLDRIYRCEHSPMRTQQFWIEMVDIPTFVSVHLVRHSQGVTHYVKSNREDRPGYSGDTGREHPVNHAMLINAQALINMSRKRLCAKAHAETRKVMGAIRDAISYGPDPDLAKYMVPECEYRNGCYELKSCGWWRTLQREVA